VFNWLAPKTETSQEYVNRFFVRHFTRKYSDAYSLKHAREASKRILMVRPSRAVSTSKEAARLRPLRPSSTISEGPHQINRGWHDLMDASACGLSYNFV